MSEPVNGGSERCERSYVASGPLKSRFSVSRNAPFLDSSQVYLIIFHICPNLTVLFRGPNEWWKSRSFDGKISGLGGTISCLHGEITGFGGAIVSGLDGKGSGFDGEVHANRRPEDFIGAIIGGEQINCSAARFLLLPSLISGLGPSLSLVRFALPFSFS